MSVINKVLRDLDQRQSGSRSSGVSAGVSVPGQSAASPAGAAQRGRWVRWGVLLSVLLALLASGSFLSWRLVFNKHLSVSPGRAITPTATQVLPSNPVQVADVQVVVPAPAPAPVPASTLPPPGLRSTDELSAQNRLPAPKSTSATSPVARSSLGLVPLSKAPAKANLALPAPVASVVAPRLSAAVSEAVELKASTTTKPAAMSSTTPATPATPATARPLKPIAQEALAQAQAWWQQGNQTGALELVRGIMVRLEQSPEADAMQLAAAAREYVRMVSAQGRAADALALLVRLEPRLSQVPDIWALRGNTAQRLGLHPQAVSAYRQALALRPGQARWLLGLAVSLAAQGQTGPAADLAQQAAGAGYLPVDVANYLRQLGVELRAP